MRRFLVSHHFICLTSDYSFMTLSNICRGILLIYNGPSVSNWWFQSKWFYIILCMVTFIFHDYFLNLHKSMPLCNIFSITSTIWLYISEIFRNIFICNWLFDNWNFAGTADWKMSHDKNTQTTRNYNNLINIPLCNFHHSLCNSGYGSHNLIHITPSQQHEKINEASSTLYLNDLPYSATEAELERFFSIYGTVKRVVITKKFGFSQGYGYIVFEQKHTVESLLCTGTIKFKGYNIKLRKWKYIPRHKKYQLIIIMY